MKNIVLSVLLCFAASNVFALTAEDVLKKSDGKILHGNLHKIKSYEVEYEYESKSVSGAGKDVTVTIKETVDGENRRMDAKSTSPEMDGYIYASLIAAGQTAYSSTKYVYSGGVITFSDYMVVRDTGSISTYNAVAGESKIYDSLDISFDSSQAKDGKEYVINMSVKDKEAKKSRERIENMAATGEEITAEEFALSIMSPFEIKSFIDKKTLLLNAGKVKITEEAVYNKVAESKEHSDKSEEEKRKIAGEISNNTENFSEMIFSGYKQIEGTTLFYPSETIMKSPVFKEIFPDGIFCIIRTKSFKVLKPGEAAPSTFVPANIKKGKGKVPKEFTNKPDIYGVMTERMKKEIIKALKESIKETVKEEGKNMLKKGIKGAFKGLGGL
ncbi:MAG: DUF4981 domain-containing protein [Endomicrobium sp.]|nr:DUF4981 domain-containing protein [Endomicrobium sp.]